MKKYLMIAFAALAVASCSKMDDVSLTQGEIDQNRYDAAFKKYLLDGKSIAPNQTWGFSADAYSSAPAFDFTRSQAAPAVAEIVAPFDEAWVTTYNETAKEPNSANVTDNYDNSSYASNWDVLNAIPWDGSDEDQLRQWFTNDKDGLGWDGLVAWALANRPNWVTKNDDETFVRNFKITGTYDGAIAVVATEGLTEGVANNNERTVVVTGTWNITADQRVGSKGRIIIANGGTVNVANGVTLNMVNQARLVVLSGGKLTGAGKVEVNNGNATGEENYNGGTIDVAVFNNNFGKFYNYGEFKVNEYHGGAAESNFYNHALAAIDHFGIYDSSTANARIFNGCQFYVKNDARIRNYEGVQGSALIVGGQLMCSGSEDGTSTPTYVSLEGGALVQAGSLYNNGTSWNGPTSNGYAVLSIGKFDYLNWQQDAPQTGGYFINNIYVQADDWTNAPGGNGMGGEDALAKFANVQNAGGNGNVTIVDKGDEEVIPADDDFVLGQAGCTPGFKIKEKETPNTANLRIIAEDLSATGASDFDFNDVVLDVTFGSPAKVVLVAAGGTLPLRINGNNALEVHKLFGVLEADADLEAITEKLVMVNTGAGASKATVDITSQVNVSISTPAEADSKLKLEVFKNGEWQEMKAPMGEPACKLAVDPTFKILTERKSIKNEYPLFVEWATATNFTSKWW